MARTKQTARTTPRPSALDPLPAHTEAFIRTGEEAVAYHIPNSPSAPSLKTTISLPRYSNWSSGLHFHATHTEYLRLVKGAISVHLNGEQKIISAKAGGEVSSSTGHLVAKGLVVKVPKYARHEWKRAEALFNLRSRNGGAIARPEDVDEEVVVEEWTDPADLGKPLFFWNLNGVITAPSDTTLSVPQRMVKLVLGGWWIPFQLFVIFWELDNWPVFLGLRGYMGPYLGEAPWVYRYVEGPAEYAISFIVLFVAKVLGWLVGVRAVEKRRTPTELWDAYNRHGV
jgi:hypothetical protein